MPVEDIALADFRAQVDTNLFGVVNVTKAALPVLREQGGGHVIQVSSIGGRLATPGLSAYQASKWAVGGWPARSGRSASRSRSWSRAACRPNGPARPCRCRRSVSRIR